MSPPSRSFLLLGAVAAGLTGLTWGCFTGEGTIGAFCFDDSQCGIDQGCRNSICGKCGDRIVQPGELCFGNSSEENVFGEVADLAAFAPEDGVTPQLAAVVNGQCPLTEGACWALYLLVIDEADGDFEVSTPIGLQNPGTVPQVGIGNFDGEGFRDVAFAIVPDDPLADTSAIAVLYDFPETMDSVDLDVSIIAQTLHTADLDGDGFDDMIVGGRVTNALSILHADPGADLGFELERLLATDMAPRIAPPVDMDNDGDLDLVIASETTATVGVDLNDGNANFTPQPRQQLETNLAPTAVVTGDFDDDGNMDVAVVAPARLISTMPPTRDPDADPSVVFYRGNGDGSLTLVGSLDAGEDPASALATDINNDGLLDIVIADRGEDRLPTYINRGGSFPDAVSIDVAAAPQSLMREDFDLDGIPDIVVGNANGVIAVVPSEN